jgi:hypothetical protein
MEAYRKLENPTLDDKYRALVELEKETGIPKCESISAYRIWFKRNHPGKTKKGKDAAYRPISFKQAELMAEDSCNDFSCWLLSDKGFLIVTGKQGEPLSPGVQGLYTYSRWCGHRSNVWRSINSAPKPDSKPLSDRTLKDHGKRSHDRYGKHLDTYRADFHGMPMAKLSQSFVGKNQQDGFTDTQQAQTLFYTQEKETVIHRTGLPCQAGWMTTRVDSLHEDNRIGIDDINADPELAAIGRIRMGV